MPDVIDIREGAEVLYDGRPALIDRHVSLDQALIKFEDGSFETVKLSKIARKAPPKDVQQRNEIPLEAFKEKSVELARSRLKILQPILDDPKNNAARVKEAAENSGFSISTIYRWLAKYEVSPRLTSLMSKASRKRKKRLDGRIERIITDTIAEEYKKPKRVSQEYVIEVVQGQCKSAKLKVPHANTIRSRISELSEKEKIKGRRGSKIARQRHAANKGKFPEGAYPLECVQMDTHELDIIIVSSDEREAIGVPYVTLAIDTFSRMVVGYHLSLDRASAYTAGACVHHMILPKDKTLERLGNEGTWPVWGLPANIHVDNGKDFRSKSLQRACEKHHMTVEFRPPGFPDWGGHVESFFDTLKSRVHNLDGNTKSNTVERRDYDSIKGSTMTFEEFEQWLVTFIVAVYHNRIHSMIEVPPIQRWNDGIKGLNGFTGIGEMPMPVDSRDLRLDFLPSTERTVGKYGIKWSKIHYYSDILDRWINEKKGGKSVKHILRRDPHDISKIYFFDPELEKYFDVPYSNIAHPSIDQWELQQAQVFLAKRGLKKSGQDEDAIFEGIRKMREIEIISRAETAKASRVKRRNAEKKRLQKPSPVSAIGPADTNDDLDDSNVTPLPSKPKPAFTFSGRQSPEITDDDLDEDFGEWS